MIKQYFCVFIVLLLDDRERNKLRMARAPFRPAACGPPAPPGPLTVGSRSCSTVWCPCSSRWRWAAAGTRRTADTPRARTRRWRAAGSAPRWSARIPHTRPAGDTPLLGHTRGGQNEARAGGTEDRGTFLLLMDKLDFLLLRVSDTFFFFIPSLLPGWNQFRIKDTVLVLVWIQIH